ITGGSEVDEQVKEVEKDLKTHFLGLPAQEALQLMQIMGFTRGQEAWSAGQWVERLTDWLTGITKLDSSPVKDDFVLLVNFEDGTILAMDLEDGVVKELKVLAYHGPF